MIVWVCIIVFIFAKVVLSSKGWILEAILVNGPLLIGVVCVKLSALLIRAPVDIDIGRLVPSS
ncbi:hypothetical protein TAO_1069 [Candidatus Nitrosoglobus terrae]|uniref:Uncharacterized protein n=1 Tax=Candidatus Nitrosoglobus terrae TaxID=1630141 RepID=A0A1Q2SMW4_9GAMM|nr:hypothetical protein TAO_1069 [Candidatus Nitrosoglobus terrae]